MLLKTEMYLSYQQYPVSYFLSSHLLCELLNLGFENQM